MRRLIVTTFLTLDGVMQAPGGPGEDDSDGFAHGGWSVNYWDDTMNEVMTEFMGRPFDLVLGRKTYEIFAAHWPHSQEEGAAELNAATKHVASTTLTQLDWQNSRLIEGDVPAGVRALKEQDGPELQVHGSATLLQTLIEHGLVDQFNVWIFPVVLGKGKRLFGDGTVPDGLELVDSQVSSTGVIMATYRPGAEIKAGSFALEEPSEAEVERRSREAG
jgi:dihydrofolate reductase